jgi:DnaJ-domain-containing protein 1
MLFDEFLYTFNKLVFDEARLTKSISSTINEVLKSDTFNSLNLHDGKQHTGSITSLKNADSIKYTFNTVIGIQYARFEIHFPRFLHNTYWENEVPGESVVRVNIDFYKIEEAARHNWKGKYHKVPVASISFYDKGQYNNEIVYEMKAHFERGCVDDIEVIVKGKCDPDASKFNKVGFKYFPDYNWTGIYSMNMNDARNEQKEACEEFLKEKSQKHTNFKNEKKQSTSSNNKEKETSSKKSNDSKKDNQQNDNTKKYTSHDEAEPARDRFTSTDYYLILGVKENATEEEIRKAYRTQMQKAHPDKTDDPYLLEIAKKLNVSYGILSNSEKRKNYDEYLSSVRGNESNR